MHEAVKVSSTGVERHKSFESLRPQNSWRPHLAPPSTMHAITSARGRFPASWPWKLHRASTGLQRNSRKARMELRSLLQGRGPCAGTGDVTASGPFHFHGPPLCGLCARRAEWGLPKCQSPGCPSGRPGQCTNVPSVLSFLRSPPTLSHVDRAEARDFLAPHTDLFDSLA